MKNQLLVTALTTPGVVSHIAAKLDSTADLGALFVLLNDPYYRYELEPIAAQERQKRERRLAKEREETLINELFYRITVLNKSQRALTKVDLAIDMYVHLHENIHLFDTTNDRIRNLFNTFKSTGIRILEDVRYNIHSLDPEYRVYVDNKLSAIVNCIACFC